MQRLLLLLAILMPAIARADAPKATVKGPSSVIAGGTIVLDARASVSDEPLSWQLDGPDVPFVVLDQDARKGVVALIPSAPAGKYTFIVIAQGTPIGGTKLQAHAATLTVTVDGPTSPAPPPPPQPPTPAKITGPLHVSLVISLADLDPQLGKLRAHAGDALKAIGVAYRGYTTEDHAAELARLNLSKAIADVGTPTLLVQTDDGEIVSKGKAPADVDAILTLVKQLRGSK